MKRSMLALALLLAACHPQGSGAEAGATTARSAVETFLAGARAQDIQVMSNVFGGERGLTRDQEGRREHEMRMLSLMCYLSHDAARIVNETPGDTQRSLLVELTRGRMTGRTTITAVSGPRGRWFVSNVPVQSLGAFCRSTGNPPA